MGPAEHVLHSSTVHVVQDHEALVAEVDVLRKTIPVELAWNWISFSRGELVVRLIPSQLEYVISIEPTIDFRSGCRDGVVEWVLRNLLEDEVLACLSDV